MVGSKRYNSHGFSKCNNLKSIVLPQSVTSIGYCAFQYTSISSIDLRNIISIDYLAFYNCSQLTGVIDMPKLENTEIIRLFYGTSITEVKSLGNVTKLGNTDYNSGNFKGCTKLQKVNLPDNLSYIGRSEFANCTSLSECNIPASVTEIIGTSFANCSSLNITIDLPNLSVLGISSFSNSGVVGIDNLGIITTLGGTQYDEGTFQGCSNLEYAILPESLTRIGQYEFSDCPNLKIVVIYATIPPELLGATAFRNAHSDLAIYVPDASVTAYKDTTNWSTYADRIRPLSEYTE